MKSVNLIVAAMLLSLTAPVKSAEFFFAQSADGGFSIQMTGDIVEGDYDRLLSLIENSPVTFLGAPSIYLSSRGGSVDEALRIGSVIEKASLMAVVREGENCASACFLIYVSAPVHIAVGNVLIHRPYITDESYEYDQSAEVGAAHQIVMKETREYLELKAVPPVLIDKMMKLPSTDAYRLNMEDLSELGMMSPFFEEVSIGKCGVSESQFLSLNPFQDQEKIACVNGLRDMSRAKLLIEVLGKEAAREPLRAYLLSRGGVESADGRITGSQ